MFHKLLRALELDGIQIVGVLYSLGSLRDAILMRYQGHDIYDILLSERAGTIGRHGADDPAVQRSRCLLIPFRPECIALQRWGFIAAVQIAAVAGSALVVKQRLALLGLLGGEQTRCGLSGNHSDQ